MEAVTELFRAHPWLALLLQCAVAVLVGIALHALVYKLARHAAQRFVLAERVVVHTRRTARWLIPLLLVHLTLADAPVPAGVLVSLRQALSIAIILVVTAFAIRLIAAVVDSVVHCRPISAADNLRARSLQTQVQVLARVAMFIVGVLGVGSVLMTFPNVRQIGASLLASAGVAGIVAGLAARPVLGNLIAGLQIALTQPIRIDDVLIVENEWGRVEEITETYVVIRIWDDRRLIVPLEYFIQKPFQNWTRSTSELTGSVVFWVDYRMPIEPLREKLQHIVEAAAEWDRRVCVLQVTDVSERAMQLRALVSAGDAGRTWDLRCKVREALIAYMQTEFPAMLPQTRATVTQFNEARFGAEPGLASTNGNGRPAADMFAGVAP